LKVGRGNIREMRVQLRKCWEIIGSVKYIIRNQLTTEAQMQHCVLQYYLQGDF